MRSRSCGRVSLAEDVLLGGLGVEFVPSLSDVGSLEVGFWKGTERKRVDSILAEGICARM